MYQGIIFSKM